MLRSLVFFTASSVMPGIAVDVTTKNQILQVALGPQLAFGRGWLDAADRGGAKIAGH